MRAYLELPGRITELTPVMDGDEIFGIKIAMTLNLEPAGVGPITQDTVFVYGIADDEITKVQTTGTSGDDNLVGFGSNDLIIPLGAADGELQLDSIHLVPHGEDAGKETIVIRLADVEAGSKLAVYGFDPSNDELSLLDMEINPASSLEITSITVEDTSNFSIAQDLITEGQLNLFAVGDGFGFKSILYAADVGNEVALAEFYGVSNTQLATANVTLFNPDMLLETLPT